jgi:hypothetical protein
LNEINYQVVQAIAGRTRIRVPWLKTNEEAAGKLQRLVESLHPVTSVRINPLAQSIIIFYRASAISPPELEAQVASAIQQANPVPNGTTASAPSPVASVQSPMPAPEVASPSPGEAPTATTTSPAVAESSPVSSPIVAEPVAKSAPTSDSANFSVEEIPSPWDEPPEVKPVVQPIAEPEVKVPDAIPKPVATVVKSEPVQPEETTPPAHSTASLAKRLNTTSQAITHRRNHPDFPTWTQSQDPDRIAWKYDAAAQSFGPVAPGETSEPVTPAIASKRAKKTVATPAVETPQPTSDAAESPPEPTQKQTPRKSTKSKKSTNRRSSTKR